MAFSPPVPDEDLLKAVEAQSLYKTQVAAAAALGLSRGAYQQRLRAAALKGFMLGHPPSMPGFEIIKVTTDPGGGQHITQKQEHGDVFEVPKTHFLGKMTVQRDPDGRVVQDWIRVMPDEAQREAAMRAFVEALKEDLVRAEPVELQTIGSDDRVNQYTVTDYHFGMMAWGEETGGTDWDLKLQEQLWCKWWLYAITQSPEADTAILAQLGDLVHFDGLKSITPAHGHVLDSDSRFSKIVRTVIRCMRFAVRELLKKHLNVHLIFSDANHDEAGEVWMREMFAAHFEDEPRVTVDRSPGSFNAFEWGLTSLFYHHGHKKKFKDVDTTWVGRFREVFGRTKFSYGHTGHLHSDEMFTSNTGVKVERHETLAAPSSYEANAGYNSGRSAKVITYSKRFGEVGRIILTPEMVAGASSILEARS
jgi:hypothetical protein